MLRYLSVDIVCSSKLKVHSRKTVCFSEQIMSADDFQASFHTKWRLLFIQHNDPGQDKQLDLKSNELNIRPLGFPKSTHGKVKVNSDRKGVLKGQKFKGEYETELEL